MKNGWKFILGIAIGVIATYYVGGMCNFLPFIADDFAIRAVGFCTLIICVVLAICTSLIISAIQKNRPTDTKKEK